MRNYIIFDNLLTYGKFKNLTSEKIEKQIVNYPLTFMPQKQTMVVECTKFNPFLFTFYKMISKTGIIPKQDEFAEEYIKENTDDQKFKRLLKDNSEAIKARLYRSYPSFVRDICFAFKLRESGYFEDVVYNEDLDVYHGIDILIIKNSKLFGLHLFTKTFNANKFRKVKDSRHETEDGCTHLDVTVNIKDGEKVGKFFLFGPKQIDIVKKETDL